MVEYTIMCAVVQGGTRGVGFVSGGLIPPSLRGTRNDGLAHACDWFATFRDLADMDPQGSATAIDSLSLRGMLFNQTGSPGTDS